MVVGGVKGMGDFGFAILDLRFWIGESVLILRARSACKMSVLNDAPGGLGRVEMVVDVLEHQTDS
jgi:hypothetical protein